MPDRARAVVPSRPATREPLADRALIELLAVAVHSICRQLTAAQLREMGHSVERAAFENPDFGPIVIGNYRWRLGQYPAEPEYAAIERRSQQAPHIAVPAITIDRCDTKSLGASGTRRRRTG